MSTGTGTGTSANNGVRVSVVMSPVELERARADAKRYALSAAAAGAAIAVAPIPAADFFIITPIQAGMVLWIGRRYGYRITPARAKEIFAELLGVIGLGYLAQQMLLTVYKFVPVLGGMLGAPWVFGVTVGIGTAATGYFESGMKADRNALKEAFRQGKQWAAEVYKTKPSCYKKPQVVPLARCNSCDWRDTCTGSFKPERVDG